MKLSNDANSQYLLGCRKAAILVASLDTAAADAVLDQLSPEQARHVREIMIEMDDIDQSEQRRVIDEFTGQGAGREQGATQRVPGGEQGVEWLPSTPSSRLATPNSLPSAGHPLGGSLPFHFLQETEAEKLVRVLSGERPQTIALVLSHLTPARAGAVLAKLPESMQVDVIHRLVDLEETEPEILRAVEEALRSRLSQQVEMQRRRVAGLQAVAGILHATDGRVGMQILDNLASRDSKLAEKLGPRTLKFDDLADLDESVLAAVYDEAGPELILPALFGAAPDLVTRFLAALPQIEARAIQNKLNHPEPIRLRDVEEARRQVARIASRMNYRVTHTTIRAG
jgi:flagellar motor switch protein FliG